MRKLRDTGVTGLNITILRWICSYLTDRYQHVVIKGERFEPLPVMAEVPQGSVLGPLLFLIYIDGVTKVPLSPRRVLYANDMLLFRPVSTAADYVDFQNDIDLVSQWVKKHYLTFNVGICSLPGVKIIYHLMHYV